MYVCKKSKIKNVENLFFYHDYISLQNSIEVESKTFNHEKGNYVLTIYLESSQNFKKY